jgi:hypothetical protein
LSIRTVIEEPQFSSDLDAYRRLHLGIDDVYLELTWLLATQPRIGETLYFAPDFRLYQTPPHGQTPAFWIMYTFDDNHVRLYSIQRVSE